MIIIIRRYITILKLINILITKERGYLGIKESDIYKTK